MTRIFFFSSNKIKKSKKDELNKKISSLEDELEKNKERQFSLYNDKADGIITAEQFADFNTRLSDINTKTSEEIKENKKLLLKELEKENDNNPTEAVASAYRQIDILTTQIVCEFIERIYICKNDGQTQINIHWNI